MNKLFPILLLVAACGGVEEPTPSDDAQPITRPQPVVVVTNTSDRTMVCSHKARLAPDDLAFLVGPGEQLNLRMQVVFCGFDRAQVLPFRAEVQLFTP